MDVFVAFDIETTGTDARNDHITEIAAYKFARSPDGRWVELGKFSMLVNPGMPIPPVVRDIIPITDAMVAQAPDERTAVAAFKAFVGNAQFVGHNCGFDLKFISHIDPSFTGRSMLDTYWISKVMLPGKPHYTLVDLIKDQKLKRYHSDPHRAWSNSLATAALFAGLVRAAELLPAPDLEALRKARAHTSPMWTNFLNGAVHGNGVGAPVVDTPVGELKDPTDWWTEDVPRLHAQPLPVTNRRWHLGDQLRPRAWLEGIVAEIDPNAGRRQAPPSEGRSVA